MAQPLSRRLLSISTTAILCLSLAAYSVTVASPERAQSADIAHLSQQVDARDKAIVRKDEPVIHPYTEEDFDVRRSGVVVLLCGHICLTGSYISKAFASHYRYTDIYVRRSGMWKITTVWCCARAQFLCRAQNRCYR
jgi:hypothetical protein